MLASEIRQANRSLLLDLPLEVVLKILEVMHPSCLLVLSRVSKPFRALLMHNTSANIWKCSLSSHEPALPECPYDMSVPRWVNLIYEKPCNFCFSVEVNEVDWYLRVRVCRTCAETHVKTSYYDGFSPLSEHASKQLLPQSRIVFERLIPAQLVYLDAMSFFAFALLRSWRCLKKDYERVEAEYIALNEDADRRQFLEDRAALANESRAHAHRCELWSKGASSGKHT